MIKNFREPKSPTHLFPDSPADLLKKQHQQMTETIGRWVLCFLLSLRLVTAIHLSRWPQRLAGPRDHIIRNIPEHSEHSEKFRDEFIYCVPPESGHPRGLSRTWFRGKTVNFHETLDTDESGKLFQAPKSNRVPAEECINARLADCHTDFSQMNNGHKAL